MNSQLLAAAATGDEKAWNRLVASLAPTVWDRVAGATDFGRAVDAGSVVFHRLADECQQLSQDDVFDWVASTTDAVVSEAEAAGWRLAQPAFEHYDGVPPDLIAAAHRAYPVRAGGRKLATPLEEMSSVGGEGRGVTVAWRSSGDAERLPLPAAVWNGRYAVDEVVVDVTLLVAETRRLIGSAIGLGDPRVRLRTGGEWHRPAENGHFRISPVPQGALSLEVTGEGSSVVTQWRPV